MHKALRRAGFEVARCSVARLMRAEGLQGVKRGRRTAPRSPTTKRRARGPRRSQLQGVATQRAVGGRHHVRDDVVSGGPRFFEHRLLLAPHRRVGARNPPAHRPAAGRARDGDVETQHPSRRAPSTIPTRAVNTPRFATPSDLPRPASSRRLDPGAQGRGRIPVCGSSRSRSGEPG